MAPKHKALPTDIQDFFKGTSAFFPPSPTPSPNAVPSAQPTTANLPQPVPERVNGRTVEQPPGIPERVNDHTPDRMHDKTTVRSFKHVSPGNEHLNATVRDQFQPRSNPPVESVRTLDVLANEVTQASILEKLRQGRPDRLEKTERYSFEIYPEQKEEIEDFLYQYKKKTGEKLSASKFIREALTIYFDLLKRHGSH